MPELFEAAMLFSFPVSWYWSIAKMLRTGEAAGKSAGFVILVCCGFVCGVSSKLMAYEVTGVLSPPTRLYLWNLAVTGFDLWLVLRLTRGATLQSS